MQYKEITKKIIALLVGLILIARPFLPAGGFLVYPLGELLKSGKDMSVLLLTVAIVFDATHISLGSLFVSLGFERMEKLRKLLLISTLVLLGMSAGFAAYLFGY